VGGSGVWMWKKLWTGMDCNLILAASDCCSSDVLCSRRKMAVSENIYDIYLFSFLSISPREYVDCTAPVR